MTAVTNGFVLGSNSIQYSLGGISNLVMVGYQGNGSGVYGGNTLCSMVGFVGFAYGVFAYYGSRIIVQNCVASGNSQIGFLAYQGSIAGLGIVIANVTMVMAGSPNTVAPMSPMADRTTRSATLVTDTMRRSTA